MRIGLDARSISNRVCGVSRAALCLIQALSKIDKDNEYTVYTDSIIPDLSLGPNFRINATYCSRKNPLYDLKLYSILKKERLDLYHSMHSWLPEFIPQRTKTVVTIHDLFSVTDPEFFINHKPFHKLFRMYFKYITKRTIKKADLIVSISNYCKKELIKHFPLSDGKVEVIYLAPGIANGIALEDRNRVIEGNYLLYIGNCRSYKNIKVLIDGFYIFLKNNKNTDLKLVIAGNDTCNKIRAMTKALGIDNSIIFLTTPSDNEIRNLYTNALAFILPSKYEGFGIPVVEAMSFGVPVVISDADALFEVAGDSALIFKKDKPEELALAIDKITSDNILSKELREKGYNRVKQFTWESSALKLICLYQRILNLANKE